MKTIRNQTGHKEIVPIDRISVAFYQILSNGSVYIIEGIAPPTLVGGGVPCELDRGVGDVRGLEITRGTRGLWGWERNGVIIIIMPFVMVDN